MIFSWLSWLAVLLVGAYARRRRQLRRRRRCRATWRPCSYREMHPQFVAGVCHLFFAGFSKKRKQTIAEVDLTFCAEATKEKKNHRKQELTAEEVAKESRGPALGKESETVLNNALNYSKSGASKKKMMK